MGKSKKSSLNGNDGDGNDEFKKCEWPDDTKSL